MKADTHFLPLVGQVIGFEENTPTANPITFDHRGRILSYYGQEKDYSYTVESLTYDTTDELTERQMNGLLGDYSFIEDPNYNKNSEFYKYYTTKLKGTPDELKNTLKSVIDDADNE